MDQASRAAYILPLTSNFKHFFIMISYVLKQNKNPQSVSKGNWFAYPDIKETVTLNKLAELMCIHNTGFSKGAVNGLLTDMVSIIKEQLLEGKNVKIADLAIFSLGIKNTKGGADSEKEFSVVKHIQGVKLRARATGDLITKSLNLDATLKKASAGSTSPQTSSPQPSPNGEGTGQTEGGTTGNGSTENNGNGQNTNPTDPTTGGDVNDPGTGVD